MDLRRKKILIYRIGSLGDTIIALPVFNKVREMFPDADITLLTNRPIVSKAPALESVLGDHFYFNRVINYPSGTRNPRVLYAVWKEIKALKIDIIINLATTRILKDLRTTKLAVLRDRLFFRTAGITKTIGFPTLLEDYALVIDKQTGDFEWEAKRLARRLQSLGLIALDEDFYWDMHFTPVELSAAKDLLTDSTPGKPIVVASIGTKRQSNDWEQHNWTALLQRLKVQHPDWQLVMVGSAEEADRSSECIDVWGGGINLCGKTSPRVSGAVLQNARLFIGHDSGPMHLAAAVGAPCVAIYSARNFPRQWFPRGNNNKIIYHKTDCAGCGLEICIAQKKKCILSITVDEVYQAVEETLANTQAKYSY
ncbi:glycosyltransferase family 9 protein [Mucilaginibacter glaciei]|uniref:Glycosyltransferase family 9 protein n=1 Tax=Mucilaginibacter glaciei TaxID=2772109 RepID=A0A926S2L0_9SPHI|nr:glycosyltransferase family 9 protein [Mucilaginibacter glaciei]MBD1393309.1 glycosyltransferase family 9 protein [Mucilaginibacter glaciei]